MTVVPSARPLASTCAASGACFALEGAIGRDIARLLGDGGGEHMAAMAGGDKIQIVALLRD